MWIRASNDLWTTQSSSRKSLTSPSSVPRYERSWRQFFYGVDWASIRDIDAPFVPHLKSITDTSYFPTDEIDQTNDLPVGAEDGDDAKKDLAFLGYTYVFLVSSSSSSLFFFAYQAWKREISWDLRDCADRQVPSLRNALKLAILYAPRSFTITHVSVFLLLMQSTHSIHGICLGNTDAYSDTVCNLADIVVTTETR